MCNDFKTPQCNHLKTPFISNDTIIYFYLTTFYSFNIYLHYCEICHDAKRKYL